MKYLDGSTLSIIQYHRLVVIATRALLVSSKTSSTMLASFGPFDDFKVGINGL